MSHAILGETFDIHGGGLDLMFPHHENERAQSGCCHGAPMVKYWMHNGLMRAGDKGKVGGKSDREADTDDVVGKISRSRGAGGLSDLIRRQTGERIRFFLLRTHYRSTIVYGEDGLDEAGTSLAAFYRFFERFAEVTGQSFYELPAPETRDQGAIDPRGDEALHECVALRDRFLAAMDDDFNTALAISTLFDLLRAANRHLDKHDLTAASTTESPAVETLRVIGGILRDLTAVLGLFRKPPLDQTTDRSDAELTSRLMQVLIDLRKEARDKKDFATGDRIRDRLAEIGVALLDKKEGTLWERKS